MCREKSEEDELRMDDKLSSIFLPLHTIFCLDQIIKKLVVALLFFFSTLEISIDFSIIN